MHSDAIHCAAAAPGSIEAQVEAGKPALGISWSWIPSPIGIWGRVKKNVNICLVGFKLIGWAFYRFLFKFKVENVGHATVSMA